MMIHHTIRLENATTRLELEVRIKRQKGHEGQLDTELQPIDGGHNQLSISMGQWVRRGPRSPWREDCFGQARSEVLAFAKIQAKAVQADLRRLCEIWAEWHLNDMQAGTTAQTEAIGLARAAGEIQDGDFYGTACAALAARGLLTDRGYKYGSKWLVKRVPGEVISEVMAICERLKAT